MSYSVNPIPSGTKPSSNFNNLNVNAAATNSQYGADHVPLDAGADNGMHQKVTFPLALAAPSVSGDQQVIFPTGSAMAKTLAISVISALGTTQLTNIQTTTVGTAPFQVTRMVTPFGLILYYGSVVNTGAVGNFTIPYTDGTEVTQFASISPIFTNSASSASPSPNPFNAGTGSCSFKISSQANLNFMVLIITRIP